MKLHDLLEGIADSGSLSEITLSSVTSDTRQLKAGCVFFCLSGINFDGHEYAKKAVEQGAVAVIAQRDTGVKNQILVSDTHIVFSRCCARFYGNPEQSLTLVGVTGTNGKTSTSRIIRDILQLSGYNVGLVGTVSYDIKDRSYPAKYTTPDPLTLFSLLAQMRDAGCTHVVMEVSSHALDQHRVEGCRFAASAFTNLTQDHLDYHHTMEEYYQAKKKLFDISDCAVISIDDAYSKRLATEVPCRVKTYSVKQDMADYTAKYIKLRADGSTFDFVGMEMIARIKIPIPGEFSISNFMAAIGVCLELGLELPDIASHLLEVHGVPGRFEVLRVDMPFTVIRDYAHTSDAIYKILEALRAVSQGKIMILFGCAGNRDRTKRYLMTEAASKLSDFVVLTSDNPRHEPVMQIIEDALPGLRNGTTPYKVIPDRYEAIEWALRNCRPGDTLLLSGKGHEDYQVLDHATIHFDEREVVAELVAKIKAEEKQ